jgi:quercetin dioxygenase-like cupin family protein
MTRRSDSVSSRLERDGGPLWFLGTLARVKLDGDQTGERIGMFEVTLPNGAAPPLHSHPQDETLYVLEGEVTVWIVEPELCTGAEATDFPSWHSERARSCGPGEAIFAPAGTPHTFRVESDTARMLTLSTPAGIERYVRTLAEPARWPWLQPPPDGPRVSAERLETAGREHGVVVHGPPPPAPPSV